MITEGFSLLAKIKSEVNDDNDSSNSTATSSNTLFEQDRSTFRQFKSTPMPAEQFVNIGLGDTNLVNCIQLHNLLRLPENATLDASSLPKLVESSPNASSMVTPNLSPVSVQELVRRAIVLTTVYCGYDKTTEPVLQVLIDVLSAFIHKICQILRHKEDTRSFRATDDLSIEMYNMFEEIGFSIPSLQSYVLSVANRKHKLIGQVNQRFGTNLGATFPTVPPQEPFSTKVIKEEPIEITPSSSLIEAGQRALEDLGFLANSDLLDGIDLS
ncbi:hypothetical protein HDE_08953 [Halotydeus destructor]|nr:hypothetical protein HDE_08953 [Halotydeus destructor]